MQCHMPVILLHSVSLPNSALPLNHAMSQCSHQVWHAMFLACDQLCRCLTAVISQVCVEKRQDISRLCHVEAVRVMR